MSSQIRCIVRVAITFLKTWVCKSQPTGTSISRGDFFVSPFVRRSCIVAYTDESWEAARCEWEWARRGSRGPNHLNHLNQLTDGEFVTIRVFMTVILISLS